MCTSQLLGRTHLSLARKSEQAGIAHVAERLAAITGGGRGFREPAGLIACMAFRAASISAPISICSAPVGLPRSYQISTPFDFGDQQAHVSLAPPRLCFSVLTPMRSYVCYVLRCSKCFLFFHFWHPHPRSAEAIVEKLSYPELRPTAKWARASRRVVMKENAGP